jgi:hypothetical protein
MEIIQKIKENVIIRNPASNHVFFACLLGGAGRRRSDSHRKK